MSLNFDLQFDPRHGRAVTVAPDVARLTAPNAGPFTFHGTNTYLVGRETLAVIDPGPENDPHFDALIAAIGDRTVSHIFVSHTHRDHSPLAARLKAATGAITCAEGPHRPARPLALGGQGPLDSSGDTDFVPDLRLGDGQTIAGDGWRLTAIHTPGHCANHACFALEGTGTLFSADHVMAWSTTIVAPPDGAMADYMASLEKLIARDDLTLLPGHGGPVQRPGDYMRGLKEHRLAREAAILERLKAGDRAIPAMVAEIYRDTDPRMHGAAALSVLAHLQDLVARGRARVEGEGLEGRYSPT